MLVGCFADFFFHEFAAVVGLDRKGDIAMYIFEVIFGVVCVNCKFIGLTCLLVAVRTSKPTLGAGGDFGSLAANSIFLQETVDQRRWRSLVL